MRSGRQNRNAGPEQDSASHHDVTTNTAGGSLSMSMNNPQNLSSHQDFISTATSPMFSPSSPMHPASPNTQLTMQLLGNLMQMQLDGGFALPSPSVPVNSNGPTGNDTPNSNSFGLLGSFNMSQGSSNANGGVNMLSSPVNAHLGSGTGNALPSPALLEQQIKLQQLQQLQQLQNQIFQQQMALISGQTVKTPTLDVNLHQQFQHQSSSDQTQGSSSYTGLPTPGPSTELRPQQQSIEFVSPMILNSYMEAESSNGNHGQQSHSHTSSPMITSTYQQHHTQDDTFSQGLPPAMASRSSIDFGQVHSSSHHQTQNLHGTHHSHHALNRGIASAPEHLAFDIRSGHEFDLDVSPLTSPWLGAYSAGSSNPNSSSSSLRISTTTDQHRQSAMRGLAGPALNIITNGLDDDRAIAANPNKRTASPSTDEASPHPARKKHSPAIGPTLSNVGGMLPPSSSASRRQSSSHRGSKSTSSTPLLRGTRNRSKSGAGNGGAAGSGNSSAMAGDGTMEHQHQHIFSISGLAHDSGSSGSSTGGAGGGITGIGPLPEDSPSPVDLSVPPSNSAHTENTLPVDVFVPATGGSRLTPVTPASIMNLGRLGMTSSNAGEQGNDGDGDAAPPIVPSTGTTTTRGKGKNRADGASKGLKPILPARDTINRTHATTSVTAENTNGSLPSGPKKTSHKAAEQKRRDSLKTTFDDLRQLLPPIAFEDAIEEEPSKKPIDKVLPVRGPLLPGALPPRGPPKAGGDGPNKGVSKLQLLICGNQYIRTLKGRVDRRDVEIAKLREEVRRLRGRVGVLEGKSVNGDGVGGMQVDGENDDEEDMGEEIDLERDLDAIEGMTVRIGPMVGSTIEEEDEDE